MCAILESREVVYLSNVLITGGAGFLGLNIALEYLGGGDSVIIVDDMKNSYVEHIHNLMDKYPEKVTFYKGDVCDKSLLDRVFSTHHVETVLHMAAYKNVSESKLKPSLYHINNIGSLRSVLHMCDKYHISKFALPSTAVVYGEPKVVPIAEDTMLQPLSPYAETKVSCESILSEWHKSSGIPTVIFRFSNPVGANTEYHFGDHSKKGYGNLLPYIIGSALEGKPMVFRGCDHPTHDGTAVRDYIYVSDLARVVHTVLTHKSTADLEVLNVGSGKGTSVLDIVHAVENVLGRKLDYSFSPRNEFEGSISILDTSRLHSKYSVSIDASLVDIIKSAIDFYIYTQEGGKYEGFSR